LKFHETTKEKLADSKEMFADSKKILGRTKEILAARERPISRSRTAAPTLLDKTVCGRLAPP
jgi:hypothetical protein